MYWQIIMAGELMEKIYLDEQTLDKWSEIAVPNVDLFFFETIDEIRNYMPSESFFIPRSEFNEHGSYQTIDIINSYQLWAVSKKGKYVCVAPPQLFPTIDLEKKMAILEIQKRLNRGLIYNWSDLQGGLHSLPLSIQMDTLDKIESYLIQDEEETLIVFQKEMWSLLPKVFKRNVLSRLAESYMDEVPDLMNVKVPSSIEKYINRFPAANGPNCFAATLAAATENVEAREWIITQWVHLETLLLGLEMRGYQEIDSGMDQLEPKDIVLWKNDNANIIHASFHLENGLFFNKNGQTFFNPWQIVKRETLISNWGSNISVYRVGRYKKWKEQI